jgi:hypothetical protein
MNTCKKHRGWGTALWKILPSAPARPELARPKRGEPSPSTSEPILRRVFNFEFCRPPAFQPSTLDFRLLPLSPLHREGRSLTMPAPTHTMRASS